MIMIGSCKNQFLCHHQSVIIWSYTLSSFQPTSLGRPSHANIAQLEPVVVPISVRYLLRLSLQVLQKGMIKPERELKSHRVEVALPVLERLLVLVAATRQLHEHHLDGAHLDELARVLGHPQHLQALVHDLQQDVDFLARAGCGRLENDLGDGREAVVGEVVVQDPRDQLHGRGRITEEKFPVELDGLAPKLDAAAGLFAESLKASLAVNCAVDHAQPLLFQVVLAHEQVKVRVKDVAGLRFECLG
jgi:hypothetical protein